MRVENRPSSTGRLRLQVLDSHCRTGGFRGIFFNFSAQGFKLRSDTFKPSTSSNRSTRYGSADPGLAETERLISTSSRKRPQPVLSLRHSWFPNRSNASKQMGSALIHMSEPLPSPLLQ